VSKGSRKRKSARSKATQGSMEPLGIQSMAKQQENGNTTIGTLSSSILFAPLAAAIHEHEEGGDNRKDFKRSPPSAKHVVVQRSQMQSSHGRNVGCIADDESSVGTASISSRSIVPNRIAGESSHTELPDRKYVKEDEPAPSRDNPTHRYPRSSTESDGSHE